MGFRNPFRIQVDENDVAYVTDYSPDSNTPTSTAGRPAPAAWRSSASRPTTAGRSATARTSSTTAGTSTPASRSTTRRRSTSARTRTRARSTTRAGTSAAGPSVEPGLLVTPPITNPDVWYSFTPENDGDRRRSAPRARRTTTATLPARAAGLPAAVPGARDRRRRPARRGQVQVRPGQPGHDEAPAVLRRRGVLRRVHARHAARDPARLAEPRVQDQQPPELRRRSAPASRAVRVRVRQPDGPAVRLQRRTSTCSRTATGSSTSTRTPACTGGTTSRASGRRRAVLDDGSHGRAGAADGAVLEPPGRAIPTRPTR